MIISILGTGCPNCGQLEANVREAVQRLGLEDVKIEKITEFAQFVRYDILATPALVIDDTVVSSGRVDTVDDIVKHLQERAG